jgi:OmpA-OmpF porin, OOP family
MRKIFLSLLLPGFFIQQSVAQTKPFSKKSFGVSFILNDFVTPQLIRSSSLATVIREDNFARISEMDAGIAISYFKGFTSHIDFAASLGGSRVKLPLPDKTSSESHLLLEVDGAANFKMFSEETRVNPYLIAGIGASHYKNIYGAFVPLGGGIKAKIINQTQVFIQFQYRVPVTPDANNYHMQASIGVSGLLSNNE